MIRTINFLPCLLVLLVCGCGEKSVPAAGISETQAVEPTWQSITGYYQTPAWLEDGKFGLFLHWGLYAVPAHHNEWYGKHMYSNRQIAEWHRKNFGPQDQFGYKDFIPMFTCKDFKPNDWALLFKKSGAKFVVPTAEHHDGFALWDSDLTKWDAKDMGPKRDLVGDLAKACRKQGLIFGVSNHGMEHWDFMYPQLDIKTDIFDPKYADFYGPPNKPGTPVSKEYQEKFWLARCKELVDKYQPDMVWFDNGINDRYLDPIKQQFAAYYYTRGLQWHKQVAIASKKDAYPLGAGVLDFEKAIRSPREIQPFFWQTDDVLSDRSWGYTSDMKYRSAASVIHQLIDCVSKNGSLMLNLSPRADGTIPEPQQERLLEIGKWLDVNGAAIYSTRPWIRSEEGSIRFTSKGNSLYAILMKWPGEKAVVKSLANNAADLSGRVRKVTLLGHAGDLEFTQDDQGLNIVMPDKQPCDHAFALKIEGLTWTKPVKTDFKFDFGPGPVAPGYLLVLPNMAYSKELGYGFLGDAVISTDDRRGKDALTTDFCTSDKPFYFTVDVPEGNYRVTVTLGDQNEATDTVIKAESRRLMVEKVQTRPGEFARPTFTVNVRNSQIAGDGQVKLNDREKGALHWDDQLTLEFNGKRPCVCALEIKKVDDAITVFLAGDSTVTDQAKEPWASWGQMLTRFFKPEVAIANHAESGRRLNSFMSEKRLDKILSQIKPGDYLFIQFAHNDMKQGTPEEVKYKESLKYYVDEAAKRGAKSVLVTSMHRRRFDANGKVVDTLAGFPEAMREFAKEQNLPLIDLNAMSKVFYEAMGPEASAKAFQDGTHHNNYGAYELAKCVAEGIKANVPELAKYLVDDVPAFDQAKPDPVDSVNIPASPATSLARPEGS
jgi:alpha-L-fucosidase